MTRVRRHNPTALELAEQGLGAHDAQHALVVDRPQLAVQLSRDPTIAVAGELQHNALDGITECNVALRLAGRVGTLVDPRPADAQQLAELAHR
jgi:hypothetical protein